MKYILLLSALCTIPTFSAKPEHTYAYDLWQAIKENPQDVKGLKNLLDTISTDDDKIKELAQMKKPVTTFLTRLVRLKATKETVAVLQSYLGAAKRSGVTWQKDELETAFSYVDPMCIVYKR